MPEFADYDKINEAIAGCLRANWSEEVAQQIRSVYGADIAAQVKSIYDIALDCPVDWRTASMDAALAILADFLKTTFPWLTPEAKSTLNYCYIMAWK